MILLPDGTQSGIPVAGRRLPLDAKDSNPENHADLSSLSTRSMTTDRSPNGGEPTHMHETPPPAQTDADVIQAAAAKNATMATVITGSSPGKSPDAADRFDPVRLRLSQDFTEIGVKKLLLTVPVRKPHSQEWVRVRPGDDWRLETAILELKDERETYLLDPSLWDELAIEIVLKVLFVAISRQGVLFIWPVKLPQSDGRQDAWSRSALAAAERAMTRWIRVLSNLNLGAYEVREAGAPDPTWPEEDLRSLIEIAFRDKFIDSIDHPVIRRLRGKS
jgi:hypothetical protein